MKITDLSYPPFRMKYAEAARYCGMSASAFQLALKEEFIPKGHKARGGRFWLRKDLELAMLEHAGNLSAAIDNIKPHHEFSQPI